MDRICVAYEGMEKFFPADKIVMSGNPIRPGIIKATDGMKAEGLKHFGLSADKKHILVVGGSLGCGTLNRAMMKWIGEGLPGGEDIEVIWQCGKFYENQVREFMAAHKCPSVHWSAFIDRMDLAYACTDLVLSRSGASSISEICVAGKACIFVPSPNVAEDHQTHNALALVNRGAGVLVKDSEAEEKLIPQALELVHNGEELARIEENALKMGLKDAAQTIADEAYKLLDSK